MIVNESVLRRYAQLIAVTGANVQPGQSVIIRCDVKQSDFAALVAEACYDCGAGKVRVDWTFQPLTKLTYNRRTLESLSTVEDWKKAQLQEMVDELPARIYIMSEDPDGLQGMDMEKMQAVNRAVYPITKPYSDAIENRTQWFVNYCQTPALLHTAGQKGSGFYMLTEPDDPNAAYGITKNYATINITRDTPPETEMEVSLMRRVAKVEFNLRNTDAAGNVLGTAREWQVQSVDAFYMGSTFKLNGQNAVAGPLPQIGAMHNALKVRSNYPNFP